MTDPTRSPSAQTVDRPPSLAEFLLLRIAEDEAHHGDGSPSIVARVVPAPVHEPTGRTVRDVVRDMDLWRARVLAECEAKRSVVQRCLDVITSFGDWDAAAAERAGGRHLWEDVNRRERSHAHATIYALASIYSGHPDFEPEWLP